MTGQHFRELLETVSLTTGLSKSKIARLMGKDPQGFTVWQNKGVPRYIKSYVVYRLKEILMTTRVKKYKSAWDEWKDVAESNGISRSLFEYRVFCYQPRWTQEAAATTLKTKGGRPKKVYSSK